MLRLIAQKKSACLLIPQGDIRAAAEFIKLLRETSLSIAEIAGRVGYDSQSRFTAAFKAYWGKLPRDCRNN